MEESPVEGIKMSIGNAIKEKLTETLKNADVLSMLQKIVATTPEDEESEEIRQKLQGVLNQYEAMPEAEKVQFAAQLKEAVATKISMKLQEQNIDFKLEEAIGNAVFYNLAMIAGAALLIIILVVFFGYKLYKSITDKEKKREEKKKAKQMKKKK